MRLRIENGNLYDAAAGAVVGERTLVVEDDRIVDVLTAPATPSTDGADQVLDARGRFLLPGYVDAHAHLMITTMDLARLGRESSVERALAMVAGAERTLRRGFTTVRDTGGDIGGLVAAIDRGLCPGPRIVRSGRVLSQTGGHGDIRPEDVGDPDCACTIVTGPFAHVADGPDAVRRAARHELRGGAAFLKIMTSGGVASPTDPFESVQYTAEEVRAVAVEAEHRQTYVTSHAYSPESIRLAVDNGATCIEHGNMIDAATAAHLADAGATVVPTLVTYRAMDDIGRELGLPEVSLAKNRGVFDAGRTAVVRCRAAGVDLGFGTDLLGETQPRQNEELAIRSELEDAVDVLRSMWIVNPRLCGLEGEIGVLAPGARADVLVAEVDPLDDLAALADPEASLAAIVHDGRIVRERLASG